MEDDPLPGYGTRVTTTLPGMSREPSPSTGFGATFPSVARSHKEL